MGYVGHQPESLNQPVDFKNRVNAANAHDAAGNMIQNGALVYDKENRLQSAGGVTYSYDGDGERVAKTGGVTRLYWTGVSNTIIAESDGSGNLASEYVFFNGERIARIDNPTTTPVAHYYVADNLGSATVIANEAGALEREEMYFPYGGERWTQGSDPNRYKFTGKERDAESAGIVGADGLDYFGARYYSSTGRFLSPDWAARPTAIPYARYGDPQSLNLYTYVRNDPISSIDPDGHNCKKDGGCSTRSDTGWGCSGGYCTRAETSEVVNAAQQTVTYSTTTYEATQNAETGEWNVSKTTVTTTFSTSENNAGAYVSGSSQTTTGTMSSVGSSIAWNAPGKAQEMSKSAAQSTLGNYGFSSKERDAAYRSTPSLGKVVQRDVRAHPGKYAFYAVELVGAFTPVGEAYEGYRLSIELHLAALDLIKSLSE